MNARFTALLALASLLVLGCHGSLYALSQEHYRKLCTDRAFAFEAGFNNGMNRKRLDTSWANEKCGPRIRDQARETYVAGYREGIQNAPAVVPVSIHSVGGVRGAVSSGGGDECTFNSDCGDNRSCRRWGSGPQVCMGNGVFGDPCVFSSDCLSGSCRIREAGSLESVCR
jgi:hypothetical protein